MHRLSMLLVMVLLVTAATSSVVAAATAEPTTRVVERVKALSKQFRCFECEGESAYDAMTQSAYMIRDEVRQLVNQGRSDQEIVDYMVNKYGESVLMSPPRRGWYWLAWLAPFLALLAVAGVLVRRWLIKRGAVDRAPAVVHENPSTNSSPTQPPVDDEVFRRIMRRL